MDVRFFSENIKNNPDDWTAKEIEHLFLQYGWSLMDEMKIKDIEEEYVTIRNRKRKLENLNKIK